MKVACYNCVSRFLVALDGKSRLRLFSFVNVSADYEIVGEKNGVKGLAVSDR